MSFVVACAQMEGEPGSTSRNTARMADMAAEAARLGARLVLFPEMCLTGYLGPADASRLAVRSRGPEIQKLQAVARETQTGLCFGFPERAASGLYNSMAFVDRDESEPVVYRKIHLWVTERSWAVAGRALASFGVGDARCGMWICYDCRFPEVARALALDGVTLGLAGAAWFGPAAEWELAARSRALDNGMFVAGATLQGSFGKDPFHGASIIVDPHGKVLASAPEKEERVITAEYDPAAVESFRKRLPLLQDRKAASCRVEGRR